MNFGTGPLGLGKSLGLPTHSRVGSVPVNADKERSIPEGAKGDSEWAQSGPK